MTKNIIPIICALYDLGADSCFTAATIVDIMGKEYVNLSRSTINNELSDMLESRIVALGFKEMRSYTYYLTDKGIEIYKKEINRED